MKIEQALKKQLFQKHNTKYNLNIPLSYFLNMSFSLKHRTNLWIKYVVVCSPYKFPVKMVYKSIII